MGLLMRPTPVAEATRRMECPTSVLLPISIPVLGPVAEKLREALMASWGARLFRREAISIEGEGFSIEGWLDCLTMRLFRGYTYCSWRGDVDSLGKHCWGREGVGSSSSFGTTN
jgi:hypothetical protein